MTTRPNRESAKSDWIIPGALLALSLVPALAGMVRLSELASGAAVTPENSRFFASPLPVLIHIPSVVLFSILGAFQFAPAFRRRQRGWHRTAGKILIPSGILAALSGLWMAHFYTLPPADGVAVYVERLIAGSWMLLSIGLSVRAIMQRQFATHGAWMIRAYAIGLGAGTQVVTHLPWFLMFDETPGKMPRAVMMGSAWVINAVVAELVIRKGRLHPLAVRNSIAVAHTSVG